VNRHVAGVMIGAAFVLAAGCEGPESARQTAAPAPAYEAVTLDGDRVSLEGLQGEVVLLNVWATWCVPCRREIPELQALHAARGSDGLRVVGVTVDGGSAEDQIRRFADELGMTYEIWWDPDQTAVSVFDAVGVPLTVLIDRQGRIVWEHLGAFQRGDPALLGALDTALAVTSGAPPSSSP
jgi:peroxiredoxin